MIVIGTRYRDDICAIVGLADSDLAEIVMISFADIVVVPSEVPVLSIMMLFVLLEVVWLR